MNLFTVFAGRLSILFRRDRFRSELDEEMAFHREQAEKDFVASGMAPREAHFAAMRQFGNATQLHEQKFRTPSKSGQGTGPVQDIG